MFSLTQAQQHPIFTQYMFNGLAINPAYSAVDDYLNATMIARKQWSGFEGAPNTQTLTVHSPFREGGSGSFGVFLLNDEIGQVIAERGIFLSGAKKVRLRQNLYLAGGISGGFTNFRADYSQLDDTGQDAIFTDQNDKSLNFGIGAMLFSDRFFVGLSSPFFSTLAINNNNINPSSNLPYFALQGGFLVDFNSLIKFKPSFLVKYVKNAPIQADLNANFYITRVLGLGVSWRSFDSIDLLAQIQITKNIELGYAYDFTNTSLQRAQSGTHEIMLRYRLIKGPVAERCYF
ncbi:MAG: type IX secretion system membrane protein PorP/SprF [Oligoflexus sp.]|nr:type IX secretion system membrane protein PorP/SprF [Pseudopedobacter sp.]